MDNTSENNSSDCLTLNRDKLVRPTPDNFDEYLPWACLQLEVKVELDITNIQAKTYTSHQTSRVTVSATNRGKARQKAYQSANKQKEVNGMIHQTVPARDIIKIYTVYDSSDNLIQLKFDKNKKVPSEVLRVIGLFLQFHTSLKNLTINRGLSRATIHELNRILALSRITDLCLDDTAVPDANYDILLDNQNHLRYLSLSRCKIDDDVLKTIASKLTYPLPSSKTLCVLNLASNSITDTGAKYLAEVLRTNRQLAYLNLANNSISDEGATAILEVLKEFPLSNEEVIECEKRHIVYLKRKYEMLSQVNSKLFDEEINHLKKKIVRQTSYVPPKKEHLTKLMSMKELIDSDDGKDPFSLKNVNKKDGHIYSYGNNCLAYLNLSYNNLSYFSVKNILTVLSNQKILDRSPRGLVNVCVEGNCFPIQCEQLQQIDEILDANLAKFKRTSKGSKKTIIKSSCNLKKNALNSA